MKKMAWRFIIFAFILIFTSKAFCDPSANNESKLSYVELNNGMYGIPFGVSLQEVLKWCEENKVNIINSTKEEVERKARYTLGKIKDISKAYNTDKAELSEMEKELLKLTIDKQMDLFERLAISQAERILEDLKSESFNYKGQSFVLDREFRHGETVTVGGVKKVCTDKRITSMIYRLTVTPSSNSERLSNNNLSSIDIYFKKDDSGNLTSYCTLAIFEDRSIDLLAKQYNLVFKVLSEKYGNPVYREQLGTKRNELHPTWQGVTISAIEDNTPEGNIYHLTGKDFLGYDALLWKKNIVLITKFINNDLTTLFERAFYVIYYESNIANSVIGDYEQTIKDFIDTSSKEDIKKESQMKEDF